MICRWNGLKADACFVRALRRIGAQLRTPSSRPLLPKCPKPGLSGFPRPRILPESSWFGVAAHGMRW